MSEFKIIWGTGNEFCNKCGDQIQSNIPYLKLIQNRWAKPCICERCLAEIIADMERMKRGEEIIKKPIRKEIVEDLGNISGNGWMENY